MSCTVYAEMWSSFTICLVERPLQYEGGDARLCWRQAVGVEVERRHLHRLGAFDDHGGLPAGRAAEAAGVDRSPVSAAGTYSRGGSPRAHFGVYVGGTEGGGVDRCRQWAGAGGPSIVNGAASTIGEAVTERFAREGANTVGVDRMSHAVGDLALSADLVNESQVEAMSQRIVDRFGRLDVIYNNVVRPCSTGQSRPTAPTR